jgi:hypothetical protein
MLPLSDGIPARRFPIVNALLIVANFAAFIFYELPHLNTAVYHASFYPCSVDGACRAPEPWGLSWITAMFRNRRSQTPVAEMRVGVGSGIVSLVINYQQ